MGQHVSQSVKKTRQAGWTPAASFSDGRRQRRRPLWHALNAIHSFWRPSLAATQRPAIREKAASEAASVDKHRSGQIACGPARRTLSFRPGSFSLQYLKWPWRIRIRNEVLQSVEQIEHSEHGNQVLQRGTAGFVEAFQRRQANPASSRQLLLRHARPLGFTRQARSARASRSAISRSVRWIPFTQSLVTYCRHRILNRTFPRRSVL